MRIALIILWIMRWLPFPEQEILRTLVDLTVLGGRVVYERAP